MPTANHKTARQSCERRARTGALFAVLLAAVLALAGCHDFTGGSHLSYDEARESVGTTLEPDADSAYRLGVIEPQTPDNVTTGRLDVVALLFDPGEDAPVENASIAIEGYMPMHGHGTSPEGDPTHEANGVYSGFTTLGMGGMWHVYLNVTLPAGSTLGFMLPVHAMGGDMDDMDGMDHDDMDHGDMDDGEQGMSAFRIPPPGDLRAVVGLRPA